MARRLSAEWRAEWRERLGRFRGWTGTSGEFCRQKGISRSSLLRCSAGPSGSGCRVSAIQRHMPRGPEAGHDS
jgi:hypothetical protein